MFISSKIRMVFGGLSNFSLHIKRGHMVMGSWGMWKKALIFGGGLAGIHLLLAFFIIISGSGYAIFGLAVLEFPVFYLFLFFDLERFFSDPNNLHNVEILLAGTIFYFGMGVFIGLTFHFIKGKISK